MSEVKVNAKLSNCYSVGTLPASYAQGAQVDITLQANDKTEFKVDPYLSHSTNTGSTIKEKFTVSADKKTATVSYKLPTSYKVIKLTITAETDPIQEIGSKFGAINVYIVTLNTLEEFSKKRFVKPTGATNYEFIDIGKYVNRIKRIYVPITSGAPDVLRCGNYNTEIQVFQPATDKITLDFGSVIVPSHNKNTLDYDSEVNVFLPFKGFVKIPNDYVGKSIGLVYDVNIVTGDGVAKFTYENIPFQVEKISPSSNVIYLTGYENGGSVIGSDRWDELIYYGLEPFIYLKWFDDLNNGRNNDSKIDYIKSFKGFNIFADVSPIGSTEMTVEEQQTIIGLLESGVYIE